MLLGAESLPEREVLPWQKPLAGLLAIALAVEATFIFITRARPTGAIVAPGEEANLMDSVRAMGMTLFQEYLLPFEVTSILLLVAMIGAIVLVRKEKRVH
jgi:NADH-quinone oxidoreductase subunit J